MPKYNGVEVDIPEGYFDIHDYDVVKVGDQVANVTFGRVYENSDDVVGKEIGKVSWLDVDSTEIGKLKRYSGAIVIRKIQGK